jgi:LPXTG-motif cell wall-anchored protein
VTTAATTTGSVSSSLLPTTGADLVALLVGALGSLAVGTVALVTARRRRA